MTGRSEYESHAEHRVAKCQLHGVLVRVFGHGVLLTGESGVGKTSCAIELLRRGHSLVADDAVQMFSSRKDLFGRAPDITRSLVHIRGLGIQNVTELFEPNALLDECRIDLCIEIRGTNQPSMTGSVLGVPHFQIDAHVAKITADQVEAIVEEQASHLAL